MSRRTVPGYGAGMDTSSEAFQWPTHPGAPAAEADLARYVLEWEWRAVRADKERRVSGNHPDTMASWDTTPHVALWDGEGVRLADADLRGPHLAVRQQLTGLVACTRAELVGYSMDSYYSTDPSIEDRHQAWLDMNPAVTEAMNVIAMSRAGAALGRIVPYGVGVGPAVQWTDPLHAESLSGPYPEAITLGHRMTPTGSVYSTTVGLLHRYGSSLRGQPKILRLLGIITAHTTRRNTP